MNSEEGSIPPSPPRKQKYKQEADKKMERSEITDFPPEDQ